MIYKTMVFIFCTMFLNAYELPEVDMPVANNPEIVIFDATSKLVKNKLSYEVRWKTINATDVNITFFGKVDLSGSITVTEDEYNRGPITLTASSKKSSYVDSITINEGVDKSKATPIIHNDTQETQQYYNTMPVRGIRRPINRRRYY